MELKIDTKDCLLKDLKVPAGYRVIEDWELLRESRTNKKITKDNHFFVNTSRGIMVAWLGCGKCSHFDCDSSNYLSDTNAFRGVFVKLEKEKTQSRGN